MFAGNDDLMADSLGAPILANTHPEFVVDHEAGFRYSSERWQSQLNVYFMDFDNEIVLEGNFGPNALLLTDNVESSIRMGVEVNLFYRINDACVLVNNSSFNYSRIRGQGISFSPILTPPLILNQDVRYTWHDFTLSISVRYQDGAFIDLSNTLKVESYVLINGSLGYRSTRFEAAIFTNNLTNVRYINHGYVDFDGVGKYFVQAPLNILGCISYTI
jgi:iron complex outermembrane receptor protein